MTTIAPPVTVSNTGSYIALLPTELDQTQLNLGNMAGGPIFGFFDAQTQGEGNLHFSQFFNRTIEEVSQQEHAVLKESPLAAQAYSFLINFKAKIYQLAGVQIPEPGAQHSQITSEQIREGGAMLLQTVIIETEQRFNSTPESRKINMKYLKSDDFLGRLRTNEHLEQLLGNLSSSQINLFLTHIFKVKMTKSTRDDRNMHGVSTNNDSQCNSVPNLNTNYCYICARAKLGGNKKMQCEHVMPFLHAMAHLTLYRAGISNLQLLQLEYLWAHKCCNLWKNDRIYLKVEASRYVVNNDEIDWVLDKVQDEELYNDNYECESLRIQRGLITSTQIPFIDTNYLGDAPGQFKVRGRNITRTHMQRVADTMNQTVRFFGNPIPLAAPPAGPPGGPPGGPPPPPPPQGDPQHIVNFEFYLLFVKFKILSFLTDGGLWSYTNVEDDTGIGVDRLADDNPYIFGNSGGGLEDTVKTPAATKGFKKTLEVERMKKIEENKKKTELFLKKQELKERKMTELLELIPRVIHNAIHYPLPDYLYVYPNVEGDGSLGLNYILNNELQRKINEIQQFINDYNYNLKMLGGQGMYYSHLFHKFEELTDSLLKGHYDNYIERMKGYCNDTICGNYQRIYQYVNGIINYRMGNQQYSVEIRQTCLETITGLFRIDSRYLEYYK